MAAKSAESTEVFTYKQIKELAPTCLHTLDGESAEISASGKISDEHQFKTIVHLIYFSTCNLDKRGNNDKKEISQK